MQKIKTACEQGLVIYMDCWKGYEVKELEEAAFHQFTINYAYNFVHPMIGLHTSKIELSQKSSKWRYKHSDNY